MYCLMYWMMYWLMYCWFDWLIDLLVIDWCIDWLNDWLIPDCPVRVYLKRLPAKLWIICGQLEIGLVKFRFSIKHICTFLSGGTPTGTWRVVSSSSKLGWGGGGVNNVKLQLSSLIILFLYLFTRKKSSFL